MRSKAYRRRVAELPCARCGLEGHSQAAHPNSLALGKGIGLKADDFQCVPLCADLPGVLGCHSAWDRHMVAPKHERSGIWARWVSWTRAALLNEEGAHRGGEAERGGVNV